MAKLLCDYPERAQVLIDVHVYGSRPFAASREHEHARVTQQRWAPAPLLRPPDNIGRTCFNHTFARARTN